MFSTILFVCLLQWCREGTAFTLSITLPGNETAPPVVNIIEGHNLTLTCHTDGSTSNLRWNKLGASSFYRVGPALSLPSISVDQRGDYACLLQDRNGVDITSIKVTVNVLWGPGQVTVQGPNSALKGDQVTLTCSASSNPEPSYLWSYTDTGERLEARGYSFTEANYPEKFKFYCHVKNTLIPTQGAPVTLSAMGWKHVTEHTPASVYGLQDNYIVIEGTVLDIFCHVYGTPPSTVWWATYNDSTVISHGARLVVPNVKREYEGYYKCYAENKITNAAGVSKMITAYKNTYLHVKPRGTNNDTHELCPCEKEGNVTIEVRREKVCRDAILAALGLGWILAAILLKLLICYFLCNRRSRSRPGQSKDRQSATNLNTEQTIPVSTKHDIRHRPQLPRPRDDTDGSRPVYLSLRASTLDRGNPDGCNLNLQDSQNSSDGYLSARSHIGDRGSYVEPYSTANEESESAGQYDKPYDTVASA